MALFFVKQQIDMDIECLRLANPNYSNIIHVPTPAKKQTAICWLHRSLNHNLT